MSAVVSLPPLQEETHVHGLRDSTAYSQKAAQIISPGSHDNLLPALVVIEDAGSRTYSPSRSCRGSSRGSSRPAQSPSIGHRGSISPGLELIESLQEEDVDHEYILDMLKRREIRKAVNDQDPCFGWRPLHFMANTGDVEMLEILIDAKANVNLKCNLGNTPLHMAARGNQKHAVELLISKSATLDCQNQYGWTAMMSVAMNGHRSVLPSLLSARANAEIVDNDGRNALMWAARHNYIPVMQSIMARSPNLEIRDNAGLTVMDHARQHRELRRAIRPALRANMALLEAVRRNDIAGAVAALKAGAYVNARDADGGSPIGWASSNDSVAMVRLLMQHGADRHLADWRPSTDIYVDEDDRVTASEAIRFALYIGDRLVHAAKENDLLGLRELLKEGAWPNAMEPITHHTALVLAVLNDNPDAIVELHTAKADLEARHPSGWTAVHFAVLGGKEYAVAALHQCKADFNVQMWDGDLLTHLAAKAGNCHMLQLLHVAKADVDKRNGRGFTALQAAIVFGENRSIATLLSLNADPSVKARQKRSIFQLAVVHDNWAVAEVLTHHSELPENGKGHTSKAGKTSAKAGHKKRAAHTKRAPHGKLSHCDEHAHHKSKQEHAGHTSDRPDGGTDTQDAQSQSETTLPHNGEHAAPEGTPRSTGQNFHRSHREQEWETHKPDVHSDSHTSSAGFKIGSPHASSVGFKMGSSHASSVGFKSKRSSHASSVGSHQHGSDSDEVELKLIAMRTKLRQSLPNHVPAMFTKKEALAEKDAGGRSALALAIKYRHEHIVRYAIESKADVDCADMHGTTVLMSAAAWGDLSVVLALIEAGAQVDAKDEEGRQAPQYAKKPEIRTLLQTKIDRILVHRHVAAMPASPNKRVPKAAAKHESLHASKSAPALHAKKHRGHEKGEKEGKREKGPFYRLRLENLPLKLPRDIVEEQIRTSLRKRGKGFDPARVDIVADPITQRPRGYAYLDFKDLQKADTLVQVGGNVVFGGRDGWDWSRNAKLVRELPVTETKDLY